MIRNFLQRFFIGRYGPDHLSTALIVLSLIISLVSRFTGFYYGSYIGYIPLLFSMFRILSRNIKARRRENDIYLRYYAPIKSKLKMRIMALKNIKTHKYFRCPSCKNNLRIPRGRGKLQVTCPKCGERFYKKS